MTWLTILEVLGGATAIVAAYKMSLSGKEGRIYLYHAFLLFAISDLFLFAFFLFEGKIPMVIQMIIFGSTALLGIAKTVDYQNCSYAKDKRDLFKKATIFIVLYFSIVFGFSFLFESFKTIDFSIVLIDLIASSIAVFGSYMLSSHNHNVRAWAFVMFFIADVIFVYIGFENKFYFFMLQSAFFIYTSSQGFYNIVFKDRVK